jgi:hypothetical protein
LDRIWLYISVKAYQVEKKFGMRFAGTNYLPMAGQVDVLPCFRATTWPCREYRGFRVQVEVLFEISHRE